MVLKLPRKRLVKVDPVRRKAFVAEYAALTAVARRTGAEILFADEAHFFADPVHRRAEVKRRRRTELQAHAYALTGSAPTNVLGAENVDFTLASV